MRRMNEKNKIKLTILFLTLFVFSSLNGLNFAKAEIIDTAPPEFLKIYHFPQIPNQYEGVTVIATIKDQTGIGEISLIYFVDGVEYKKEMEYIFNPFVNDTRIETYGVSIGKYKPGTHIRYFIEVNDSTRNHNYAQSLIYDYSVVADGAPEIFVPEENIPEYFVLGGETQTINFNVYDEDGLDVDGSERVDAVAKINGEVVVEGRATKTAENNFTFTFSTDRSRFNEGEVYEIWFNATDSYGQEGESKHIFIPVIEDKPYVEEFQTIPYYPSTEENITLSCKVLYREDSVYGVIPPGADGPVNGTDVKVHSITANVSINENTAFELQIYDIKLFENEKKYFFNGSTLQPIVYPGVATVSVLIEYFVINYDQNGMVDSNQTKTLSFVRQINVYDNEEPEIVSTEYNSWEKKGEEYDFSSLINNSSLSPVDWSYYSIYTQGEGNHSINDWYVDNNILTVNNEDWDYCVLSSENHTYDDFDFKLRIQTPTEGMVGIIFKYSERNGVPEYFLLAHTSSVTLNQAGFGGDNQSINSLELYYVYNHTLNLLKSVEWIRENNVTYTLNGSIYNDLLCVSIFQGSTKLVEMEKFSPLIINGKIGLFTGGIKGIEFSELKINPKALVDETETVNIKVGVKDNFKTVSATAYVYDEFVAGYQLLRDNTEYFQYYQYGDDGISFEEPNSINLNLTKYGTVIYDGLRVSSTYFSYIKEIQEEGKSKLKLSTNNNVSDVWIEVLTSTPLSLAKWNQLVITSRAEGKNYRIVGLYTTIEDNNSLFWEYKYEGYNNYCYNLSRNLDVDVSSYSTISCLYNLNPTITVLNKFYIKIEPVEGMFTANDSIIIDSIRLFQRGEEKSEYDETLNHDIIYYYGSHQPSKVGVELKYVIKASDGRNYISYIPETNESILVVDGLAPTFDVAELFGIDINDQNIRFSAAIDDTTNIFDVQVHYKIERYNITAGTYYEYLPVQTANCAKDAVTGIYYFDFNIENLLKYKDLITYWFTAVDSYENIGISDSYTIFVDEYVKPNAIVLSTFTTMEYNGTATITATVEDVESGIAYVQFFWFLETGEKYMYEWKEENSSIVFNTTLTTPSFGYFDHAGTLHYYVVVTDWAGNVFTTGTKDVQLLDHVKPKVMEIENYDHSLTYFKIENEDEYKGQIVRFVSTKKDAVITFGIYDASTIHSVSLQYYHYEFTPYSYSDPDNGELSSEVTNVGDNLAIIDWSKTRYDGYTTYFTFIIPHASYWSNNDELRFTLSASDIYGNHMTQVISTSTRIRDITNPILIGGNLVTNSDFETNPSGPYNATVTITVDEDTTPISTILYWKNGIENGVVELIDDDLTDGVHTFSQTFTVKTEGLGTATTYYIECIDGAGNVEQFYYNEFQGSNAKNNWYSVPDIFEKPNIFKRANIQYEEYSTDLGKYKEFPKFNTHFILNVSGTPRFFSWDFSSMAINQSLKDKLYEVSRLKYWDTFAVDFGGGAVNYNDVFNTWESALYPYLEPSSGLQRAWDGKLHVQYTLNVTGENVPLFSSRPVHYLKIPLNLYHNFVDAVIDFDTNAVEKIQLWAVKPTNPLYPYEFNLSAAVSLPENSFEAVSSGYYSHSGLIKMGIKGDYEYRNIIIEIVPRAEYNETSGLWKLSSTDKETYDYFLDVYNIRNYGIFYSIDRSAHQDFDEYQNMYAFIHNQGTEEYTTNEITQFLGNVTEQLSFNSELEKWNYIGIVETKDTTDTSRNRLLPCLYVDENGYLQSYSYPEGVLDPSIARRIALLFTLPHFTDFKNGYYNTFYLASNFSIRYQGSLMAQFYETNLTDYRAYSGPQFIQPYLGLQSSYRESWFEPFPTDPLSMHYKLQEMVCDAYDVYYESLTPEQKQLIDSGNSSMPPLDYLSALTWSNSTLVNTQNKDRYGWLFVTFDEFNHFAIKDMSLSALYGKIYDDFYKRTGDLLKPRYEWADPSVPEYIYPEYHERLYSHLVDFFVKIENLSVVNNYYFDYDRQAPVINVKLNPLVNSTGVDFSIILNSTKEDYSTETYFLNELSSYYSQTVEEFKEKHNIWRELISETLISWTNNSEYYHNGTLIQTEVKIELINDLDSLISRSLQISPNTIDWFVFDSEKSVSTSSSYSQLRYRLSISQNFENNGTGYILFQLPQYNEGWTDKANTTFINDLSYSYSTRYNRHTFSTETFTDELTLQTNDFEEISNVPYVLSDRISNLVIDAELNYTTSTNISYIYVKEIYATATNGTELLVYQCNESDVDSFYTIEHYRTSVSIPLSWASDENYVYGENNSQYFMMVKNFKIVFKINSSTIQSSYTPKISFYDLRLEEKDSYIPHVIVIDDFSPPQIDCWVDYPRMPDSRDYIRADDTTWYFEIGLSDLSGAELESVRYYLYSQQYDLFTEEYIGSPLLIDSGIINSGYTFSLSPSLTVEDYFLDGNGHWIQTFVSFISFEITASDLSPYRNKQTQIIDFNVTDSVSPQLYTSYAYSDYNHGEPGSLGNEIPYDSALDEISVLVSDRSEIKRVYLELSIDRFDISSDFELTSITDLHLELEETNGTPVKYFVSGKAYKKYKNMSVNIFDLLKKKYNSLAPEYIQFRYIAEDVYGNSIFSDYYTLYFTDPYGPIVTWLTLQGEAGGEPDPNVGNLVLTAKVRDVAYEDDTTSNTALLPVYALIGLFVRETVWMWDDANHFFVPSITLIGEGNTGSPGRYIFGDWATKLDLFSLECKTITLEEVEQGVFDHVLYYDVTLIAGTNEEFVDYWDNSVGSRVDIPEGAGPDSVSEVRATDRFGNEGTITSLNIVLADNRLAWSSTPQIISGHILEGLNNTIHGSHNLQVRIPNDPSTQLPFIEHYNGVFPVDLYKRVSVWTGTDWNEIINVIEYDNVTSGTDCVFEVDHLGDSRIRIGDKIKLEIFAKQTIEVDDGQGGTLFVDLYSKDPFTLEFTITDKFTPEIKQFHPSSIPNFLNGTVLSFFIEEDLAILNNTNTFIGVWATLSDFVTQQNELSPSFSLTKINSTHYFVQLIVNASLWHESLDPNERYALHVQIDDGFNLLDTVLRKYISDAQGPSLTVTFDTPSIDSRYDLDTHLIITAIDDNIIESNAVHVKYQDYTGSWSGWKVASFVQALDNIYTFSFTIPQSIHPLPLTLHIEVKANDINGFETIISSSFVLVDKRSPDYHLGFASGKGILFNPVVLGPNTIDEPYSPSIAVTYQGKTHLVILATDISSIDVSFSSLEIQFSIDGSNWGTVYSFSLTPSPDFDLDDYNTTNHWVERYWKAYDCTIDASLFDSADFIVGNYIRIRPKLVDVYNNIQTQYFYDTQIKDASPDLVSVNLVSPSVVDGGQVDYYNPPTVTVDLSSPYSFEYITVYLRRSSDNLLLSSRTFSYYNSSSGLYEGEFPFIDNIYVGTNCYIEVFAYSSVPNGYDSNSQNNLALIVQSQSDDGINNPLSFLLSESHSPLASETDAQIVAYQDVSEIRIPVYDDLTTLTSSNVLSLTYDYRSKSTENFLYSGVITDSEPHPTNSSWQMIVAIITCESFAIGDKIALSITLQDNSGNTATYRLDNGGAGYRVNQAAPIVSITSSYTNNEINYASDIAVTFTTQHEDGDYNTQYRYSIETGDFTDWAFATGSNGIYSFTVSKSEFMIDELIHIEVRASDETGTYYDTDSVTLRAVDQEPPYTIIYSDPNFNTEIKDVGESLTFECIIVDDITAKQNMNYQYRYRYEFGDWTTWKSDGSFTQEYYYAVTIPGQITTGIYIVEIKGTDGAGNSATYSFDYIVSDKSPPAIDFTPPSGVSNNEAYDLKISYFVFDNYANIQPSMVTFNYKQNGEQTAHYCTVHAGSLEDEFYSYIDNAILNYEDTFSITITASDGINQISTTDSFTVSVDATNPSGSNPTIDDSTPVYGSSVELSIDVYDDGGVSTIYTKYKCYYKHPGESSFTNYVYGSITTTPEDTKTATFVLDNLKWYDGAWDVKFTFYDTHGHSGSYTWNDAFTVLDTLRPSVSTPISTAGSTINVGQNTYIRSDFNDLSSLASGLDVGRLRLKHRDPSGNWYYHTVSHYSGDTYQVSWTPDLSYSGLSVEWRAVGYDNAGNIRTSSAFYLQVNEAHYKPQIVSIWSYDYNDKTINDLFYARMHATCSTDNINLVQIRYGPTITSYTTTSSGISRYSGTATDGYWQKQLTGGNTLGERVYFSFRARNDYGQYSSWSSWKYVEYKGILGAMDVEIQIEKTEFNESSKSLIVEFNKAFAFDHYKPFVHLEVDRFTTKKLLLTPLDEKGKSFFLPLSSLINIYELENINYYLTIENWFGDVWVSEEQSIIIGDVTKPKITQVQFSDYYFTGEKVTLTARVCEKNIKDVKVIFLSPLEEGWKVEKAKVMKKHVSSFFELSFTARSSPGYYIQLLARDKSYNTQTSKIYRIIVNEAEKRNSLLLAVIVTSSMILTTISVLLIKRPAYLVKTKSFMTNTWSKLSPFSRKRGREKSIFNFFGGKK